MTSAWSTFHLKFLNLNLSQLILKQFQSQPNVATTASTTKNTSEGNREKNIRNRECLVWIVLCTECGRCQTWSPCLVTVNLLIVRFLWSKLLDFLLPKMYRYNYFDVILANWIEHKITGYTIFTYIHNSNYRTNVSVSIQWLYFSATTYRCHTNLIYKFILMRALGIKCSRYPGTRYTDCNTSGRLYMRGESWNLLEPLISNKLEHSRIFSIV